MNRTLIEDLSATGTVSVLLQGFADTIRNQKRMVFLVMRDHTGKVQLVHDKQNGDPRITELLNSLTEESTVTVVGQVVKNESVKLGQLEVVIEDLVVGNVAATPLPITSESGSELQLDWRFLGLRRPENLLIFQVQTALERGMRDFWEQRGFIEIHSPKLMATASESGAELFELDYFDTRASLAQSPQFYKQMAMAAGFDRIFEIGPVFRANPSFTSRHDTEFVSVDMEFSWIESHEDVMAMEESWLRHAISYVAERYGEEIKERFGVDIIVPTLPFPRISLAEARALLAAQGHIIASDDDLDPAGERMLAKHVFEKHGHEFVFVTDYPVNVRPFYHMRHPDNPDLTRSFDLLWRGLEVTTGAQREHRPEVLSRQAAEKGLDTVPLQDYINFFRFGCPPHGGMGVGLTRLLMIMLGRKNVREVTYLYRGPNRLRP